MHAVLGMAVTRGEKRDLIAYGLHRYSRNPQCIADMAILIGWLLLSGSIAANPFVTVGVVALTIAPLVEEPSLRTSTERNLLPIADRREGTCDDQSSWF